jgi:signal transduction histidine kinase
MECECRVKNGKIAMTKDAEPSTVHTHNIRRFKLLFFFFTLIAVVSFLVTIHVEYRNFLQSISTMSEGIGYTCRENMLRMLEAADLVLQQVELRCRERDLPQIYNSKDEWEYLRKVADKIPYQRSLWITDASGKMLVYSGQHPTPALNVADRDYFQQVKNLKDQYYIGAPIVGKYTGKTFFSMSRAIYNAQNEFKGTVVAAIEPDYINIFKETLIPHTQSKIKLISSAGIVYSQYPYLTDQSETLSRARVRDLISETGIFSLQGSFLRNKVHARSILSLNQSSLFVVSEYGTDNIFASLWRNLSLAAFPLAVCYLLMVSLFIFFLRRMRVEDEARCLAEKALRENERRLRQLGNNMPNGMLYQMTLCPNGDRAFTHVTAGVEKIFHVSPEQLLANSKILYDMIHPDDIDEFRKAETESTQSLRVFEFFAKFQVPPDQTKWIQIRSFPSRNEEGNTTWDGFLVDMTKQHELENELRHSQKMDSIGNLAGGVAHDFNNMLTGIIGAAELMQSQAPSEAFSKYLELILRSATRASSLTNQLLTFSRKVDLAMEPVDLNQLIQDATALLYRSIDRKIEIKTLFDAKKSLVNGDAGQLQNAIINLGINAKDAMPDGGVITFQTHNLTLTKDQIKRTGLKLGPGDYVELKVTDTGSGMDRATLGHIFEPFFTTKKQGAGTGLGLAVTYGVIKNHHGNIAVESQQPGGTTFSILLPLTDPVPLKESSPQHHGEFHPSEGCRILLVEDEDIVRETIELQLEHLGFDVISAADGAEGVALFEENQSNVDLIILDVIMPKKNGVEAYGEIVKIKPEIPVIFYSGYSSDYNLDDVLERQHVYFLKKPFEQETLHQLILKALQ